MLGGKEICQSEGAGWATEEPRQVFNIEELKEAQMCNLCTFRWGRLRIEASLMAGH